MDSYEATAEIKAPVALYLDDADQRVARLRSDTTSDAAEVVDVAHGLKGSSANFGATRVRELSARIEALARATDAGVDIFVPEESSLTDMVDAVRIASRA